MNTYKTLEVCKLTRLSVASLKKYAEVRKIVRVAPGLYSKESVDKFAEMRNANYSKDEAMAKIGLSKFQFRDMVEKGKIKSNGFNLYDKAIVDEIARDIQERRAIKKPDWIKGDTTPGRD